jgi:hypothetical protein
MGDIRSRLASFSLSASLLVAVGLVGGCGDNTPKQTGSGGSGGSAGTGGKAGSGGIAGGGGAAGSGGLAGAGPDAGTGGQGGVAGMDAGSPDASISCYNTTFTTPSSNNATLTVSDDNDHTCADGFQYTVAITSDAPDGTMVTLYDGNTVLKTVTVTSHAATFDVQLSSGGTAQALSIQYPSTTACNVVRMVTVNCPDSPPTCSISKPVISATHPDLNGVAAPGGDRTSSAGSMYQATFTVQTSAEDGQPVTLAVDNAAMASAVTTLNATASGGTATFPVTLVPDGTYEVVATCTNKNGISGSSAKGTFIVDTTPPNLSVTKPTAGMFVVGGTVDVCGQTTDSDAAALPSSLGAGQSNFCVTVGSAAAPTCVPMVMVSSPSCVSIPCPGAAPFNLTISLKDGAGNPTTQTLTGITCASSHPSVQIVAPASDSPTFKDPTKHILAANAPIGVKDQDPATAGAQADVVACTDMPGTAVLTVGHVGDATLTQLGASVTTVAAAAGDNCPSGLGNVARFSGVTLPESTENADGTLAAATRLVVSVTATANSANTGVSLPDDVWVDSTPPNVALVSPVNLCGSFTQSSTTVNQDLVFSADYAGVIVEVTNGPTTTTYDTPAFMSGVATFSSVAFTDGLNNVTVTATDPAGNATVLAPNPCAVTLGMAPVVTFTTPTAGAILCPAGSTISACINDNDTGTPGWQGSLAVTVTAAGQPVTTGDAVTFTIGGNSLGSANLDANGHAQLDGITIPEGVQTIVATTDAVPNAGVGSGTVTVTVDTTPPNAPTNLSALVLDRRKTSMQLTWTAPSDGNGGSVAGYQVRYAKVPIDSSNFNNASVTTAVAYTGAPASPGQLDGIAVSPLLIESSYYFAVQATDVAGTASTILATPSGGTCSCAGQCCAAHFNTVKLTGTTGSSTEGAGFALDGSGDADGDGKSDVLIGAFNGSKAYLFLGNGPDFAISAPSVVFSGASAGFGRGVAFIGDIDHDGREELAIANRSTNIVYIYRGRATWPMTLADTDADYTVTADSSYNGSLFGGAMTRLGDFDGDGIDDFAIGSPNYNTSQLIGRVTIILGSSSFASLTLPSTTRAIVIDGESTIVDGAFGSRVLGIGPFFSPSGGSELIVSAPGFVGAPSGTQGKIYAFRAQAASNGVLLASAADQTVVGSAAGKRIGVVLTNLGVVGSNPPAVAAGNPNDTSVPGGTGSEYLFRGNIATGPLTSFTTLNFSGTALNPYTLIGGGVPGRLVGVSTIGDSAPDLVIGPRTGSKIAIIDGTKAAAFTADSDVASVADVIMSTPSGLGLQNNAGGSLVPDVNGDGYADFAISDGASTNAGQTIVFY